MDDGLVTLGLLADESRLRVAAAVLLDGGTTDDVARRAGLAVRKALEALSRLEAGGLVHRGTESTWSFDLGRLREVAREARPRASPDDVGVRYPEREVNALLRAFHPDVAALRRYLVDEGFLSRERNLYWRTGGSVDV